MFRRKGLLVFTCLVLIAGTAAGIAIATSDENATPITGEALIKARAAALEHTGGGTVTETEVGDEDGYYEVEVTMADGTEVDVHLDQNFNVIGSHSDREDETDDAKD
jgi:uncharacterized membrane protein YkoI